MEHIRSYLWFYYSSQQHRDDCRRFSERALKITYVGAGIFIRLERGAIKLYDSFMSTHASLGKFCRLFLARNNYRYIFSNRQMRYGFRKEIIMNVNLNINTRLGHHRSDLSSFVQFKCTSKLFKIHHVKTLQSVTFRGAFVIDRNLEYLWEIETARLKYSWHFSLWQLASACGKHHPNNVESQRPPTIIYAHNLVFHPSRNNKR